MEKKVVIRKRLKREKVKRERRRRVAL